MKHNPNIVQKGYTLIEMTVTLVVGIMIALIALTMFNQQLASYNILKTQNFLVQDAPQINNVLNRIVNRANFFQMYPTLEAAESGTGAVISGGKVLGLKFIDADDSTQSFGVIAYDAPTKSLNYYHISSPAELAVATPSWKISSRVHDADFFVQNGVLRITLTGPNGGQITYSATTQR